MCLSTCLLKASADVVLPCLEHVQHAFSQSGTFCAEIVMLADIPFQIVQFNFVASVEVNELVVSHAHGTLLATVRIVPVECFTTELAALAHQNIPEADPILMLRGLKWKLGQVQQCWIEIIGD